MLRMPPKLALTIAVISAIAGAICGAPLVTDHETALRVLAVAVLMWNSGQWVSDWQWLRFEKVGTPRSAYQEFMAWREREFPNAGTISEYSVLEPHDAKGSDATDPRSGPHEAVRE
jgi:hypothetical protein